MGTEIEKISLPKIAVLGLSYPFRGGIAHYSTLFVRELRKKYSVKFFSLKRQYPHLLFPGKTQYDHSKIKLIEENEPIIDSINPITWINSFRLINREGFDLIIVQWWNPFFGLSFGSIVNLLSFFSNIKICFVCHNVLSHENNFLDKLLLKYSIINVNHFIVHSEEDKEKILSIKKNAIIKKNPHPTYSIFGEISSYEKDEAKKIINIKSKNIILFFGLIRAYKGLKYLIQAMTKITEYKNCLLLIVGEFYESKSEYISLIKEIGLEENITIIDKYINNEDVPLYFCCADVVVLPYIEATQSGIIQIAFGLGKPVITTNVGGLSEAVEDQKTGFIVEAKSSEKLAEAIIKYYQGNYESRFSEEIKKRLETFSWDIELRNIEFFLTH
jgi:glycosyltransferase involved in cell wall biosynthesis